ncbi:MAG TPA: 2-oxo acid dehydrogenase subunit E2 [Anaerolineales bacterium]|nr:2-oxo acid dehydrogenase subunit E2 [Anaerolineales bacterium]
MIDNLGPTHVVELTPGRRAWLNTLDLSVPSHWMYGLLEVDVTLPRQLIADHKARTGEALSFTGFLVYCLAQAVAEHKDLQAYRKGHSQLMLFDDVNVGLMVEHKAGEKSALMGLIVQAANRKTYPEIHAEIRTAQSAPVPPNRGMPAWFRSILLLPWPLSRLVKAWLNLSTRRNPAVRVAAGGTVCVTAVGMFGKDHSGWGIAATPHSLGLVVGSIAWKPAVVAGRIEPREILNLTVLFDHDIVDGAPAARFTNRLVELIECGEGLLAAG